MPNTAFTCSAAIRRAENNRNAAPAMFSPLSFIMFYQSCGRYLPCRFALHCKMLWHIFIAGTNYLLYVFRRYVSCPDTCQYFLGLCRTPVSFRAGLASVQHEAVGGISGILTSGARCLLLSIMSALHCNLISLFTRLAHRLYESNKYRD